MFGINSYDDQEQDTIRLMNSKTIIWDIQET